MHASLPRDQAVRALIGVGVSSFLSLAWPFLLPMTWLEELFGRGGTWFLQRAVSREGCGEPQ